MSNNIYGFIGLTGGAAGDLDAISDADLTDLDYAFGVVSGVQHCYWYDDDSGAAENSPYVIKPDDAGAGNGRWILSGFQGPMSHVKAYSDSGQTITDSTYTTLIYEDESYDTLSEYVHTTGIFTPIYSGYYVISAGCISDYEAWALNATLTLSLYVDSSSILEGARVVVQTAGSYNLSAQMSVQSYFTAAEDVEIKVRQSSGGSIDILNTSLFNYLMIDRII